jgi:hypothetical protein
MEMKKWVLAIVLMALIAPAVCALYDIDPNKIGIVGGTHVSSGSYNMRIATEQESIGEASSTNYVARIGWIYTIEDTPTISDGNVSPSTWIGTGAVILGFKCSDPNEITDFNRAHASITGSNTADINNISYVVDGQVAIIAVDISSYLTSRGLYYVVPFCVDDENNVGVGTQITGEYTTSASINVISPVQNVNINSDPVISFDVNTQSSDDINISTITVDLNGTASTDFNAANDCTAFDGNYYCTYTETGLSQDEDNNVSFNASDEAGTAASQTEVIVHYDATAPVVSTASTARSGSSVVLSWTGSDGFTGIESCYVRDASNAWIEVQGATSYTFSGHSTTNHTYSVKARDFADNNSLIVQASYTAPSDGVTPTPSPPPGGTGSTRPATPAEPDGVSNIFDIKIVRIDDPVEAGEKIDFAYNISNNTLSNGNAYIEYWLEKEGQTIVSGSETVYLNSGDAREIDGSLIKLDDITGEYSFYLKLTRQGQTDLVRSRDIEIMVGAPTNIELTLSTVEEGDETNPAIFSIEIGSNRDETLPITIREKIYLDGKLIWEKKQTVPISVFKHFLEEVHGLEEGKYEIEIEASFQDQTKKVSQIFEKKPSEAEAIFLEISLEITLLIIALILIAIAALIIWRWINKKASIGF